MHRGQGPIERVDGGVEFGDGHGERRPEPDAAETAEKLRALGHDVILRPMLELVFNPPPAGLALCGSVGLGGANSVAVLDIERSPSTPPGGTPS